ncbi:Protein of unknown function [Lactobacillus acidophilus DSM 9126]|jgi:hypothetical protein
MFR